MRNAAWYDWREMLREGRGTISHMAAIMHEHAESQPWELGASVANHGLFKPASRRATAVPFLPEAA